MGKIIKTLALIAIGVAVGRVNKTKKSLNTNVTGGALYTSENVPENLQKSDLWIPRKHDFALRRI